MRADNVVAKDNKSKSHQALKSGLTALSNLTQIPITFYDNETIMRWQCHEEKKICNCFSDKTACHPECLKNLNSAIRIATQLKEPYIFLCEAGLVKIVYPVGSTQGSEGCIFLGPIPMGKSRELVVKRLSQDLPIDESSKVSIACYLSQLRVYSPDEISYVYELFHDVVKAALLPEKRPGLLYQNTKSYLASQNIQKQLGEDTATYPYQLESDLIEGIKSGKEKMIRTIFKDFFDIICAIEAGNLASIKISLMSIYGQVSRLISDYNFSGSATVQYLDSLEALNSAMTYKAAFDVSLDLFCSISATVSQKNLGGHSPIIVKAVRYISEYYSENITLESTAKHIHVSAAYLSTLFKREIAMSFTSYLSELRIHQSLKLLTETNIDLTTIAYTVGFNSQSYYAKVFKESIGVTPKEYRKSKGRLA